VRLAALVTAATGELVVNADEVERTNQYYTFSRYPQAFQTDASEEPSASELESMISTGRRILEQARHLVARTPESEPGPGMDTDDRADSSGGGGTDHIT
jgi:hypothetical protein